MGIFARGPELGRVKTRLASSIGAESALRLHVAFVQDTLSRTATLNVSRVIAYAPSDPWVRDWFRSQAGDSFSLWPQPEGDLGERLRAFFAQHLLHSGDAVTVIGSDSPTLPVERIVDAFQGLNERQCVLTPAADGGYVLMALRAQGTQFSGVLESLFAGVDWGGPQVLSQTVERLQRAGLSHRLLEPWYDVDTLDDLRALQERLAALHSRGVDPCCPATIACLQTLKLD